MRLSAFSKFEGPDIGGFAVCILIGFFFGSFAPAGSPASFYITVLVSYHFFLAWLILFSSEHKEAGVSLPIWQTLLTHAACMFVIIGPVVTAVHRSRTSENSTTTRWTECGRRN
jgi:hypothetical protein